MPVGAVHSVLVWHLLLQFHAVPTSFDPSPVLPAPEIHVHTDEAIRAVTDDRYLPKKYVCDIWCGYIVGRAH